jgi:hypothetical protein
MGHNATNAPRPITTALAQLRLPVRDAADLRWLLQGDYEGDLGLKSRQGDLQDFLELQTVQERRYARKPVELDERILKTAGRLGALRRRWAVVDPSQQGVLQAFYGETRRVLPEWGDLGPIIVRLKRAHELHARSPARDRPLESWLAKLPSRGTQVTVAGELRRLAEQRLQAANRAWLETWARVRPSRRPEAARAA